jgi:hypothetical protein
MGRSPRIVPLDTGEKSEQFHQQKGWWKKLGV